MLRQPHHVAVEADHVAAVVHDGDVVLVVDNEAHAVRGVLADGDLRGAACGIKRMAGWPDRT